MQPDLVTSCVEKTPSSEPEEGEIVEKENDGKSDMQPIPETTPSHHNNNLSPLLAQVVDPLSLFEQIFAIYVRAHKEGRSDSMLNENVRKVSRVALCRLVDTWRCLEAEEKLPLTFDQNCIEQFLVSVKLFLIFISNFKLTKFSYFCKTWIM